MSASLSSSIEPDDSDTPETDLTVIRHTDTSPGSRLGPRGYLALTAGRLAAKISRFTRLGSGGMIGGAVALKIDPAMLNKLSRNRRIALVTGTNGKTSTTKMLSEALAASGKTVASNRGGDNMTAGILAALMQIPKSEYAVLEVDEMHLKIVAEATRPEVMVLLNLSRDQLDRVGEISAIEKLIRHAVQANPQAKIVTNVDDPLMTSAAWEALNPIWVAAGKGWTGDCLTAPRSGEAIVYETSKADNETASCDRHIASGEDTSVIWRSIPLDTLLTGTDSTTGENYLNTQDEKTADTLDSLNQFNSPTETMFSRPKPKWIWQAKSYQCGDSVQMINTETAQSTAVRLALPGRANRGNALQAFAAALALGIEPDKAARGISKVSSVAGRYAQFEVKGRLIRMLLAKNPAGWMESLTMLNPQAQLIVGVNGQRADGTDLSWLWDVNFEALRNKTVIATGERGSDLQVRLNYAGVETLWTPTVMAAIEMVQPGPVDLLLNYTSFRDARAEFLAKGWLQ